MDRRCCAPWSRACAAAAGRRLRRARGPGEVELDHRRQHGEQDQRMQADQRDVQGEAGLAVERRRQRDADLHGVAERRGDRPHARRRGLAAAGRAPRGAGTGRPGRAPRASAAKKASSDADVEPLEVDPRRGAKQQRRHEDVERGAGEHPRRVAAAEPAAAFAAPQPIATTAKIANSLMKTCADMGAQYRRQNRHDRATALRRSLADDPPADRSDPAVRRPAPRHLRPAQEGGGVPAAALPRELRAVDLRRARRLCRGRRSSSAATAASTTTPRSRRSCAWPRPTASAGSWSAGAASCPRRRRAA